MSQITKTWLKSSSFALIGASLWNGLPRNARQRLMHLHGLHSSLHDNHLEW